MATPDFETLVVGDSIPSVAKPPFGRLQLALFAGAAADHNPIHVDDEAARNGGLPGVIAHGMLTMAFLAEMLGDWVPVHCIRSFSSRFNAMARLGDAITCRGVIAGKSEENGEKRVELELTAENQNGEKVQLGRAIVALS